MHDRLSRNTYPGGVRQVQVYQRLLDALRAVPGVEASNARQCSGCRPIGHQNNTRIADATIPPAGQFHVVDYYQYVIPDYFETMDITIVRGRGFEPADATSRVWSPSSDGKVRRYVLERAHPIGQRVKPNPDLPPWFTVVGVAKDVKQEPSIRKPGPSCPLFSSADRQTSTGVGVCATRARRVAHDPHTSGLVTDD